MFVTKKKPAHGLITSGLKRKTREKEESPGFCKGESYEKLLFYFISTIFFVIMLPPATSL